MKRKAKGQNLPGQPLKKKVKRGKKHDNKNKKKTKPKPVYGHKKKPLKKDPQFAKLPCSSCGGQADFNNGVTPEGCCDKICYCCYACYVKGWPKHRLKCVLPKMKEQYARYLKDKELYPKDNYKFDLENPKHEKIKGYRIFRNLKETFLCEPEPTKCWRGNIILNRETANYNEKDIRNHSFYVQGSIQHYDVLSELNANQDPQVGFSTEREMGFNGFNPQRCENYLNKKEYIDEKTKDDYFCKSREPDFKDFKEVKKQCLNLVEQFKMYYKSKD